VLLLIGALVVIVFLLTAAAVVVREANHTTEVEAAPGYSLAEATAFVISRLPDATLRRMRRSEVERLVAYCLGLLERAGVALNSRRPQGDELEGEEMVLDVKGLTRAMGESTSASTAETDLALVAGGFLEYLSFIGAVGDEMEGLEPRQPE
jgi:hypothetical protein